MTQEGPEGLWGQGGGSSGQESPGQEIQQDPAYDPNVAGPNLQAHRFYFTVLFVLAFMLFIVVVNTPAKRK